MRKGRIYWFALFLCSLFLILSRKCAPIVSEDFQAFALDMGTRMHAHDMLHDLFPANGQMMKEKTWNSKRMAA